jgi:hypothetical protein
MSYQKDLIVLLADLDAENAVRVLLRRHHSLGIRKLSFDIIRHRMRDSGCCKGAVDMLRPFLESHRYAIVIFDHHGSGRDNDSREAVETDVEHILEIVGWAGRVAAVVLDPELETWVWSDSPKVAKILGWYGNSKGLDDFLTRRGFPKNQQQKPESPKEAMIAVLRHSRKARSASLFSELARQVGLGRCTDDAFAKFKRTLYNWFKPT